MAEKTSSRTTTALSNDFGEKSNYGPVRCLEKTFRQVTDQINRQMFARTKQDLNRLFPGLVERAVEKVWMHSRTFNLLHLVNAAQKLLDAELERYNRSRNITDNGWTVDDEDRVINFNMEKTLAEKQDMEWLTFISDLDPNFEPKLSQFPTTDLPSAAMSVDNASSPAAHIQDDDNQSDIISTIKPQDTVIKSSDTDMIKMSDVSHTIGDWDKQSKNIDSDGEDQLKSTNMLRRVVTNIIARTHKKYTEAEVTKIAGEKSTTVWTERELRETVYEVLTAVSPVSIDLKLVLPNLYLGSIDSVFDANCRLVADKEISHLVLCSELEPVDDLVNSLYKKCPAIHILVIAHEDFVQFKFSCEFLRFVQEGRDGENRACIVCDADMLGISGLLLCVYTMIINRTGIETAIKSVKGAHADFCPAELQLRRFDAAMPLVMQSDEVREFVEEYKRPNDIMEMDDFRFQKANLKAYYVWFGKASKTDSEGIVNRTTYNAWLAVRDVLNESIKRDDAIVHRRRRKSVDSGGFQSRPSTPVAASTSSDIGFGASKSPRITSNETPIRTDFNC